MWLGSRTCRGECEPLRSQRATCSPSSSCPPRRARSSPCARSLGNGVVARLWPARRWRRPAPATRWSSTPPIPPRRQARRRGAARARPACAPAWVRVTALRLKGTKIELLYAHNGGEWLARFSKLRGRGALRGKVLSHWTGSRVQVRLRIGHRSLRPSSVKAIKAIVRPSRPPPRSRRGCHASRRSAGPRPDQAYDDFFQRSGPGWTGGDGTYSVSLPDGRTAWSFGDSFLGMVSPDGTRPSTARFVKNTIVLQSGSYLQPQAATAQMAPWWPPASPTTRYWPAGGSVEHGKSSPQVFLRGSPHREWILELRL